MTLSSLDDIVALKDTHQVCPSTQEHFLPAAYLFYLYLTVIELSTDSQCNNFDEDFLPVDKRKVV